MKPHSGFVALRLVALFAGGLFCAAAVDAQERTAAKSLRVYFGTYTGKKSEGIYAARFDAEKGRFGELELVAKTVNPSFLALHPEGTHLYAVNETGDFRGESSGAVSAFRMESAGDGEKGAGGGRLELLSQVASKGGAPCHLIVDRQAKHVLVANYSGGSVAVLPIREDGGLEEAVSFVKHEDWRESDKPRSPRAHAVELDASGRFAVVADLGLDALIVYAYDAAKGRLEPHGRTETAPGSGPRHFAFHPRGRFAYLINETDLTVQAYAWDREKGELAWRGGLSSLPPGAKKEGSTAEIAVHPSGRFVYGSNRGHDSIGVFAIDRDRGTLQWVENESTRGRTPRHFAIDPTGRWLLAENQASDEVRVFRIDPETGALEPTEVVLSVPSPVCAVFLAYPDGAPAD